MKENQFQIIIVDACSTHWAAYFIARIHPCSRAEAWIALLCHLGEGRVPGGVQGAGDGVFGVNNRLNMQYF